MIALSLKPNADFFGNIDTALARLEVEYLAKTPDPMGRAARSPKQKVEKGPTKLRDPFLSHKSTAELKLS